VYYITDKLPNYKVALRDTGVKIKHAQKFLAAHGLINNFFRHQRHLAKASTYRLLRERTFDLWAQMSCAKNLVLA
jgi:hypothetical protein